jgi:Tfp pilus assembly protein PilN
MPNAFSDVNFIPDEVVSDRKHESQVKSLNRFAVVGMIIALLVGFGLLGYNIYTKNKIKSLESEVQNVQTQIQELNEFAESGYKLGLRLSAIKAILDNRPYYGKVIEELYKQVPEGVTIHSLQVGDKGSVIISGLAYPNYIPIATLQDNLKTSETNYFTDIRLRSAALDKSTGQVTFTIEMVIDLTKIYEPI